MRDEQTWLQAILDNPEDDGLRLIYADWLEEKGDPRSELIRVQCALAELPETDERRAGLEVRELHLLEAYAQGWTRPLRELTDRWENSWEHAWEFRRGFIEKVTMSTAAFCCRVAELVRLVPVRGAELIHTETAFAALARLPELRRLNDLALGCNYLTGREWSTFAKSPHLGRLQSLHLTGYCFGTQEIRRLVGSRHLGRLTALALNSTRIGPEGGGVLASSELVYGLKTLSLTDCHLGDDGVQILARSLQGSALRSLDLSHHPLSPDTAGALTTSPTLDTLGLRGCALGAPGLDRLLAGRLLPRLEKLALGRNGLSPREIGLLVNAPFDRLRWLDLSENQLQAAGVRALARSPLLGRLWHLGLAGCGIGDAGVQCLAQSRHAAGLTSLDLSDNLIDDEGWRALVGSEHFPQLQRLTVRFNSMSPAAKRAMTERFGNGVLC